MFRSYLKLAFRNLERHKVYSIINIAGLSIGMACVILIALWVQDELNYDSFHKNASSIYRVLRKFEPNELSDETSYWASAPPVIAEVLKNDFPEVINSTRLIRNGSGDRELVKYKDHVFYEGNYIIVDPSFFEIFTFPFIRGNPETALSDPQNVVLSEAMAGKYFGEKDPIGETLLIDGDPAIVSGVVQNCPANSTIQFDYIGSFKIMEFFGYDLKTWRGSIGQTFIQLRDDAPAEELAPKIADLVIKNSEGHHKCKLILQSLSDIHLTTGIGDDFSGLGDKKDVYIFSLIAFMILAIACFNFMNLSTARSEYRSKEVGLRKVVGSNRSQLIKQFLGESILLASIAGFLAILIVELMLPFFNHFSGKLLTIDFSNIWVLLSFGAIILFVGIVAGSYPAFYLSAFHPIKILKGLSRFDAKGVAFRKTLVVFQFSLTIGLIICTMVIYSQIDYMRNKELGFDKDNIIYIPIKQKIVNNYETIKSELLNQIGVLNVSAIHTLPTNAEPRGGGANWIGRVYRRPHYDLNFNFVDWNYFEFLNCDFLAGRNFSKNYPSDASNACILNEAAVNWMEIESPIGTQLTFEGRKTTIIGVVKNTHFQSFKYEMFPHVYYVLNDQTMSSSNILVKINSEHIHDTIASIKKVVRQFEPELPFEYDFLDTAIANQYQAETKLYSIFNYFTFLAIFISCLGLFGLTSFTIQQRTKEVAIRKTLGASIPGIMSLLSMEYLKWIIFANLVAVPVAYYGMNKWLQNFAYRNAISWWMFVLAGLLALVIALITVSYQSIKAALANPVESLRYE